MSDQRPTTQESWIPGSHPDAGDAPRRPYETPRILFRQPFEASAAVCSGGYPFKVGGLAGCVRSSS